MLSATAFTWFARSNSEASLVAPVQELVRENEKWYLAALSVRGEQQTFVTSIARNAGTLYHCSKNDAEKSITELAENDLAAALQSRAQAEAYVATIALKTLKSERSNWVAKNGVGVQRLLCALNAFLQSFSGVAEIMKAADQQFGGLACGTVVLLATVAVNKQQREEAIEEMLEEIAKRTLLIQSLASWNEKSVITIVIDRLDQCNWANDRYDEAEALRIAVGTLVELVSDPALAHLRVSILLVMDEGPARHTVKRFQSWKDRGLGWRTD
ncbi:hypothetical protein BDW02DRAFT_594721 [Decorospora gaudefroyi]|uniref:DUF7708 domain-containing protein n=1 Tax=Decorospora gaudefroyi TaxID=184978 RepID=A0A6A5KXN6_9PLEO|nr:hypothetical protein BDW02DRAFT_594721 [Decorospora gaudefroyi]